MKIKSLNYLFLTFLILSPSLLWSENPQTTKADDKLTLAEAVYWKPNRDNFGGFQLPFSSLLFRFKYKKGVEIVISSKDSKISSFKDNFGNDYLKIAASAAKEDPSALGVGFHNVFEQSGFMTGSNETAKDIFQAFNSTIVMTSIPINVDILNSGRWNVSAPDFTGHVKGVQYFDIEGEAVFYEKSKAGVKIAPIELVEGKRYPIESSNTLIQLLTMDQIEAKLGYGSKGYNLSFRVRSEDTNSKKVNLSLFDMKTNQEIGRSSGYSCRGSDCTHKIRIPFLPKKVELRYDGLTKSIKHSLPIKTRIHLD